MDKSDTEVLLKAIFEGVSLAANEGRKVTYVFACETPDGPASVAVTIGPHSGEEDEGDE